ncbi:hypothetical protein DYB26_002512 [Aphanomyces astaci]|uniref:Uncharacterized protein n=2 Tax=Aphanomyces astaci TaxID=112090 RepID=A0A3R6W6T3_APHAT|nr:hypothetical protein DYB26_002512 [Aphanomyces astaci]
MSMSQFTMMKMFLAALGTSAVSKAIFHALQPKDFEAIQRKRAADPSHAVVLATGGLLLGIGMDISGSCPGSVYVQLGAGIPTALPVFGGVLAGTLLATALAKPMVPGVAVGSLQLPLVFILHRSLGATLSYKILLDKIFSPVREVTQFLHLPTISDLSTLVFVVSVVAGSAVANSTPPLPIGSLPSIALLYTSVANTSSTPSKKNMTTYNKVDNQGALMGNWVEEEALRRDTGSSRYKTWSPKEGMGRSHPRVIAHSDAVDAKEYKASSKVSSFADFAVPSTVGPRERRRLEELHAQAKAIKEHLHANGQDKDVSHESTNQASYKAYDPAYVAHGVVRVPPRGRGGFKVMTSTG